MKLKPLNIILIFFGSIMFIWYLLPVVMRGLINIGNIAGMLLFGIIIVYGVFSFRINSAIMNLWQNVLGKIIISLVSFLIAFSFVLVAVFSYQMYSHAHHEPDKTTTLVVLGCRVYGTSPSLMLKERLDAAYEYLEEHLDVSCVVSGGQGENEDISEAKCMYNYLIDKGIDEKRIFLEDQSTSTRENLLFSKNVIEQNDLPEAMTIVTNEFHQYRAFLIAKNLGLEAYAVSGHTALWLFPTYYTRELFGLIYQFLF